MADGFQVIGVPTETDGDAAAAAACLADEVAIDFPSLKAILDRMRRAFFGGDPAASTHVAEISLTPREAFSGTNVALDVPVSATCGPCGGRGEIWMEPCSACGGAGAAVARQALRVTVPRGVRDGARFRFSVVRPSASPTSVEVRITIR